MSRIAVVSGGGTGIGRSIAAAFARDGDQVVLIGRRAQVLDRAAVEITKAAPAAPAVATLTADLSEIEPVERARAAIARDYGRVDVLVNCAGGNRLFTAPPGAVDGLAGAAWQWQANFQANVLTAVLLTEAVRDLLVAPGGRVVLMSSIAAIRGSGSGSYGGAKAALHPYAYDLAAELGRQGITVNVVAPGYVADTEFFSGGMSPDRERALIGQTLTGRAGAPDDVAAVVRWLASPSASHITAQIIQVNGGAERGR
jgi:3-oxoacyl-[acyl-carrier protein] reductase